jgi:hypothetical protein
MARLWVALGLLGLMAIGFWRTRRALSRLLGERAEVEGFLEIFGRYSASRGNDRRAYGELLERSYRIQELLGPAGVMAHYMAPFQKYTVRNYDIILNALPTMKS